MPIDPNVFDKIKNYSDYAQADQDFQMRKALAAQQLQTGGIDAASKGTMLGAQLQAQASANGDQATYEAGKARAASLGLDTSTWASDPATGAQQANATIQAFTPVTKLLSTAAAIDQAAATRSGVTGDAPPPSVVQGLTRQYGMGGQPSAPTNAQPLQQVDPRSITPGQARTMPASGIMPNGQPQNIVLPASSNPVPNPPASIVPPTETNLDTILGQASAAPKYAPPAYDNSKTPAWNKQNQELSQKQYELQNAGQIEQDKARSAEMGKAQADSTKAAVGAKANFDQVLQTINGIKALNNSSAGLPQDRDFIPASTRAKFAQNLGDTSIGNILGVPPQAQADNANAFTKLNEAQTIGAIKELASTGQIRMTRTLENILNRGYLIEPGSSQASKNQQADLILAELNNAKVATQNVNAGLNGGQSAPYQTMPISSVGTVPAGIKFLGFK